MRTTAFRFFIPGVFIACFLLMLAFSGKAHSATATWAQFDHWTVYGDTTNNICAAKADYDSGRSLTVVFHDEVASLVISGINVTPGQEYEAVVLASNGASGTLKATATNTSTVVFVAVNSDTLGALVKSKSIAIEGLGSFQLTGSAQAMHSAWDCYQALNSF